MEIFTYSPRLDAKKLKRLYKSEASGMLDEELLEDVALTLYMRCRDILAVKRAQEGFYRCPYCHGKGEYVEIHKPPDKNGLVCPRCAGAFNADDFRKSYKRKQLNPGGAVKFFERYICEYEAPADSKTRMLQVDALIHGFHYSLAAQPDQPTRSVGPNLLDMNYSESLKFLDMLSGYCRDDALNESAEKWRAERDRLVAFWPVEQ